ncbi:hypothetical protein HLASF_1015 [Halanaeroarchaeum sulfurireducens]|uniref:Uncharacterized protein n=1 Tax=Halanaeroarchaeum sulfurireducens TaxID=1604004 RepID=A0A0F7PCZ0_9EURY|nr:hypothetical protein HLASF_1015 [Halanaeroarchaeum sulfurireducens]ALG81900.1 hypothetical protein HLASA_1004 [Halanaeroarchaeum sulfurireducens]
MWRSIISPILVAESSENHPSFRADFARIIHVPNYCLRVGVSDSIVRQSTRYDSAGCSTAFNPASIISR